MATEIVSGADIAEQGNDSTVITIGEKEKDTGKYKLLSVHNWDKSDTMPTAGKIFDLIIKHNIETMTIDANGIGAGVCSRLQELYKEGKHKCKINPFKGGMSPDNDMAKERFLNIKAQAYWRLRELFEQGKIQILRHNKLINQLNAMKWEFTSSKKIIIRDPGTKQGDTAEQKSPDYADSLCYMCWQEGKPALSFGLLNMVPDKDAKPKTGQGRMPTML